MTLAGLADSMTAPFMTKGGRAPLTDAILRAAVRSALASTAGPLLRPAKDHSSTIDALVATYREMRTVDATVLDQLALASERGTEVVSVIWAVRELAADWFDEVDVLDAATRFLGDADVSSLESLGSVVVYLPSALTAPGARVLRALGARVSCTAVIGTTGDGEADKLAHQLVTALQPTSEPEWGQAGTAPMADEVLSAPTADAELLLVLRDVMARCEAGTPPERIAIVHAGTPQYVTLLHNSLQSAGIPFNGSGIRPLSATVAGRMLLGALSLVEHDWRREDVADWLATGPLRYEGRDIPATRWDVLSAEAGVLGGLDHWHVRLEARAHTLRTEARQGSEEGDEDDAPWRTVREAEADRCDELLRFLDQMAERVSQTSATWADWAEWAKKLLGDLIGGPATLESWPVAERAAAEAIEEAIGRLGVLDTLRTSPQLASAKAALTAELEQPAPQTSRFGTGIWVASVGAVVGLSLDVLYVVGMNDGVFPGRPSDDVLLPDREREEAQVASDGSMPLRGQRGRTLWRDYLAALAGAQLRVLSYPRGNQRDGRDLRPSRWLLDSLGPLSGSKERLYSSDMDRIPQSEHYRVAASYIGAVAAEGTPISLDDRDTRSLLRWTNDQHALGDHWLPPEVPQLERGLAFLDGARSEFTRFNGNLGDVARSHDLLPELFSATRLESFANCPRRYFFESVLRVMPRPESESLLSADPRDRGTLIHRILERFVRPQIGRQPDGGSDDPFDVAQLLAIAEEEMATFVADGLSGGSAAWSVERGRIMRELRIFAEQDRLWRQELNTATIGVEQAFGHGGADAVAIEGGTGQPVRFRGTIDRIDVTDGGRRIVTDYKTGNKDKFAKVAEDHFLTNRSVQLAVYGLAVRDGKHPVTVEYWFVTERGEFKRLGYDFTPSDAEALQEIVHTYAETIGRGHFPANPGPDRQCDNCPYLLVCPTDRHFVWDRVKHAPILAPYVGLVEP